MNKNVYEMVNEFIKKYPMTIAWRAKKHSKVVEKFLNPDEEVKFAFAAQKNDSTTDIFNTYVFHGILYGFFHIYQYSTK